MAAPFVIPFNFQPVNSGNIANAGYTVPAGKYARVIATLNVSARVSARNAAGAATGSFGGYGTANSKTIELWLRPGEVITVSSSAVSTSSTSAVNIGAIVNGNSNATLSVGGTVICSIDAPASDSSPYTSTSGNCGNSLSGTATVNYRYEEFNVIS